MALKSEIGMCTHPLCNRVHHRNSKLKRKRGKVENILPKFIVHFETVIMKAKKKERKREIVIRHSLDRPQTERIVYTQFHTDESIVGLRRSFDLVA